MEQKKTVLPCQLFHVFQLTAGQIDCFNPLTGSPLGPIIQLWQAGPINETKGRQMGYGKLVERVAADPGTSFWLRKALADLLDRDPCDAANDAAILAQVMNARLEELHFMHARG